MKYPQYFICATKEYATHEKAVPAPLFRAVFHIDSYEKVQLVICGLGLYRVFCNGNEITRGRLASCPSNPDQLLYYETYDITKLVQQGKNVIGILLGNGMLNCNGGDQWAFGKASYRSAPKTAFSIIADGNEIFSSHDTIKTHSSAITYDDIREGESYDARLELDGWCTADFDDSDWTPAISAQIPKGICVENMVPPIIVSAEYKATSIRKVQGGHIFEFPINTAGICRLQLHGRAGQKITMQHVEALDGKGNPFVGNLVFGCTVRTQMNEYICKEGWQTYEPSFTYHGFRYVFITGLEDDQANERALVMLRMHANLEKRARLDTSNSTVNQILAMIDNSNLSNLLHFPTDCPQREKNGWAGDISVSAHQMALQYDMQGMFGEWMRIYRESQRIDGALPGYVPTADDGYEVWTGPSWSMSLFLCAYYLYRYHGNLQFAMDNSDAMERYLDYVMSQRRSDGMIAFGLGDWCQTTVYYADRYTTPNEITDTLATVNMTRILAFLLAKMGRPYEKYEKISGELLDAFQKNWIEEYRCKCPSQTAQALAVHYGAVSPEQRENGVKELVRRVHASGDIMDVGILGGYVLFDVLSKNGYAELAGKLILQTKAPSYGYFACRGETTLRESLMGHGDYTDDTIVQTGQTISSLNHHFWGFIYPWFVENMAGVTINEDCKNPNYAKINIPVLLQDRVAFSYRFPCGEMTVEWERCNTGLRLKLNVPSGATVLLYKDSSAEYLTEGKYEEYL